MRTLTLALAVLAAPAFAQMSQSDYDKMHAEHHGPGGHVEHDEATMPGLRGLDASAEESAELQAMFIGFQSLNREVEEMDNGIRTYTWSEDPALAAVLISHVTGMINRVEEGRDPKVIIQSPTLDVFFLRGDAITTELEVTDQGIWVTQTSDDPELVAALKTHAAEVSDMAERGMQAVHERMMGN